MGERYDLCILGAGPSGFAGAMRAHDLGKHVALIEANRVGGAGLHEGALSSKTMWHLSNDYCRSHVSDRGFQIGNVELSYEGVMASVNTAVGERRTLLCRQLEQLQRPSSNGGQVTLIRGYGRFTSPHSVAVTAKDGSTSMVEADHFLIATGSTPRPLPGTEIDGDRIVTSDHIESWPDFPESMVVVGSGVIGCEYATIFGHYGRTKIAMIDRRPRILPFEDEDVAECVAHKFEEMGIVIHREAKLESLAVVDDHVEYVVTCGGKAQTHRVERALISIGRVPNIGKLNLEAAGVELGERGGVRVEDTRTSQPHIHAAGDTTMDVALANVAELEGRHAVEAMFGLEPAEICYDALSAIMFLDPEVASVGLNEQQARERNMPYRAAVVSNKLISRNIAMRNTHGFIKLLATPDHEIIGLRVVGPQASSCIQGIAFLIELGAKLDEIDYTVHPHPAVTEGVQECARVLLGRSLLKPEVFGDDLLRVTEYDGS